MFVGGVVGVSIFFKRVYVVINFCFIILIDELPRLLLPPLGYR